MSIECKGLITYEKRKKGRHKSSLKLNCMCVYAMWEKAKTKNWLCTCYNQVEDSSKECQTKSNSLWSKTSQEPKQQCWLSWLIYYEKNTWNDLMHCCWVWVWVWRMLIKVAYLNLTLLSILTVPHNISCLKKSLCNY